MTQSEALAILESGQSVLLTGAAGTGKTYVLNQFISRARKEGKTVAVTATTGLAATHLNGNTLHAWSGIGVKDELGHGFFQKLSKQRSDTIMNTDVLIVDEISMLHDFRLDMVEEIARKVRGGDRPFGGIQVVLCGDFFQLPPVSRHDSRSGSFVTASQAWASGAFSVCYLEQQYRQVDDALYTDILNGIRAGFLTRTQLNALQARSDAIVDPFTPRTRLLTTNADVDEINLEHLAELPGETHTYTMESSGGKQYQETLKRSCLASETLFLKQGAIVMCIKNSQDRKYVNGSLGTVTGFVPYTDYPKVTLLSGREITLKPETWELVDGDKRRAQVSQLPLRLAWAITVHKSQGMTLDAARIDLRRAFVEGMGYVALSRVRGLKHLILDGFNGMALRVSPLAREIDAELRARSDAAVADNAAIILDWETKVAERKKHPEVEEVKTKSAKAGSWNEKLEKMRADYPNAYKPWTTAEDEKLVKLFGAENTTKQLSKLLGRHPGSIRSRLKKHFGDELIA